MDEPRHPDAVVPERVQRVLCDGISLCVYEWGDPESDPVLLNHGAWDTGRGFDSLAPLLAEHFRVVAIDARGHGESDRVDIYGWPSDVRDLGSLMDWLGKPAHLIGHSRGGGQVTDAATIFPEAVRKVVNLDGFGPPEGGFRLPGEDSHIERDPAEEAAEFFDTRRGLAARPLQWRPREHFDDLVKRRAEQNPRLTPEWMRYFAFHCARRVPDGWIWKVDPRTTLGFGPWQPDWIAHGWSGLQAPLLAVTGDTPDAWGPCDPATMDTRLQFVKECERAVVHDAGHFIHMERPRETARLVLDFLSS